MGSRRKQIISIRIELTSGGQLVIHWQSIHTKSGETEPGDIKLNYLTEKSGTH